ncbi:hypothetical protein MKX01_005234 [Papaver californicum]|nr:hypothetical protein MKX01_005234 [Papaver californicum]
MATVIDSSSNNLLNLDSIPTIDLRLLSQSDLHSLSSLSSSSPCNQSFSSNLHINTYSEDQIINPVINRSIFNESAGSRKQTYSRLRLLSSSSVNPYNSQKNQSIPSDFDPESKENKKIVSLLHQLFTRNSPKGLIHQKDLNLIGLEKFPIVNCNGAVVDFTELGILKDPFDSALKKRTVGLNNEVDLLGFLRGLEGIWGSRRKKRKIVDASDFGDFFPIGWKLLLSVRRKDGKFSLFCRRYISPNGLQFKSCKEVSTHLLSLSGPQDVKQSDNVNSSEDIDVVHNLASVSVSQVI